MLKTYYANINVKKPFNLLLHTSWSHELASYSNSTSGVTLYLPTKVHKWVMDKDLRKIYENLLKANTRLWDIGWYCKCHQPGLSVSKATWINHFSLTISNLHRPTNDCKHRCQPSVPSVKNSISRNHGSDTVGWVVARLLVPESRWNPNNPARWCCDCHLVICWVRCHV